MKKVSKSIAVLVALVGMLGANVASARTLDSITTSFDRAFSDHVNEGYNFKNVFASYDRLLKDTTRKVDYNTIVIASFERDMRLDNYGLFAKKSGRNSYELAVLGWEGAVDNTMIAKIRHKDNDNHDESRENEENRDDEKNDEERAEV
ncbi:hypothetical protein MNBD_NITROSPINAE01-841 [hydrothermal vent metagenome]|uniref:Uncharacterized protein n=1 Tax=hydrothermal vent metagenome TaxID=652676 RepID=A0A3B1BJF0_9ZZZZ